MQLDSGYQMGSLWLSFWGLSLWFPFLTEEEMVLGMIKYNSDPFLSLTLSPSHFSLAPLLCFTSKLEYTILEYEKCAEEVQRGT